MATEFYKDGIDNFFFTLEKAKEVKGLFQLYQQMLHNLRNFSIFHLGKVRIFINELYLPSLTWSEERKKKFNSDPNNITRFKTLLGDLYDYSKSKNYKYYLNEGKNE